MRRSLLASLIGVLLFPLLLMPQVLAHGSRPWYPVRWADSNDVTWRFDSDFPYGGGIRRAVKKGSWAWNQAGARFRFDFSLGDWGGYGARNACPPRNGIHWGPIDGAGGALARTFSCFAGDRMISFQIKFDSDESWNRDPGAEPLPWESDIFAVAAHEFGHAAGRIGGGDDGEGHYSESSDLCPDLFTDERHTMCPSTALTGSSYARTLERHDVDAFRATYGRR